MNKLAFAVALLDGGENLLGASMTPGLPGKIDLPASLNLREADLRPYLAGDVKGGGGRRRFALVSATWVMVKGRQVRLGVYVEGAEEARRWERLDLDLSAVLAILKAQIERAAGETS